MVYLAGFAFRRLCSGISGKKFMVAKRNTPKNRPDNDGRDRTGKPSGKDENGTGVVAGRTQGLCKDCKKRKTCDLQIREEGVWRCKNYA